MGSHLDYQVPYQQALGATLKAIRHTRYQSIHPYDTTSLWLRRNNFNGWSEAQRLDKARQYKPKAFTISEYEYFIKDINGAVDLALACCHRTPQSKRYSAVLCEYLIQRTSDYIFPSMMHHYDSADSVRKSIDKDYECAEPLLDSIVVQYTQSKFLKLMMII